MKQENQGHCHSDHFVMFLSRFLDDIRNGDIQVPKFQRPFASNREDRLELLRNIRDGVPMGAVTIWQTSEQKPECYESLSPFKVNSGNSSQQYLLNGVQHLSILLNAIFPKSDIDVDAGEFSDAGDEPSTENLKIHFDFNLDDFIHLDDLQLDQEGRTLPLDFLFDSIKMLKFQRQFDERDTKNIQCNRLGTAFRDYRTPVIRIVTENVAMATRTFGMVNGQDRATSEEQMIRVLNPNQDTAHPEPFQ